MSWIQLKIPVTEAESSRWENALLQKGALSITYEDAEDNPIFEPPPGETPLWEKLILTALFEANTPVDRIFNQIASALSPARKPACKIEILEDQVWERAWLEHFKPMAFGERLWVCPTGFECPDPNGIIIDLDPGLAFGTGSHPTTALCLGWLDRQDLTGKTLVDYGCGSGILAIAAAKLGADQVIAIDIDRQALLATEDNARRNQVEGRIQPCLPEQAPNLKADAIVANILAGPLIELAPVITGFGKPGAPIALSGLLAPQADGIVEAYQPYGQLTERLQQEDWLLLSGQLNH